MLQNQRISKIINNILPKTNIPPENAPSQEESSLPIIYFQMQTVGFREGTSSMVQYTTLTHKTYCE